MLHIQNTPSCTDQNSHHLQNKHVSLIWILYHILTSTQTSLTRLRTEAQNLSSEFRQQERQTFLGSWADCRRTEYPHLGQRKLFLQMLEQGCHTISSCSSCQDHMSLNMHSIQTNLSIDRAECSWTLPKMESLNYVKYVCSRSLIWQVKWDF